MKPKACRQCLLCIIHSGTWSYRQSSPLLSESPLAVICPQFPFQLQSHTSTNTHIRTCTFQKMGLIMVLAETNVLVLYSTVNFGILSSSKHIQNTGFYAGTCRSSLSSNAHLFRFTPQQVCGWCDLLTGCNSLKYPKTCPLTPFAYTSVLEPWSVCLIF